MEGRERGVTLLLLGALVLALAGADLPHAVVGGGVGAVLGWLADRDRRTHRVPNRVVLPATGALLAVLAAWSVPSGDPSRLADAVLGAAGAGLVLLAVAAATRGGVGLGDVKVAALAGLWAGWLDPWGPAAMLVAAVVAGGVSALVRRLVRRTSLREHVAFVPSLALGTVVATWWTRWGI